AIRLKDLKPNFFIIMSESSYPGYRQWLIETCRRAGFTPRVVQDVEIETTLIQSVAVGVGVALMPNQLKRLPHQNVLFRPLTPKVMTESCIAWKADDPSPPMRAYIEMVTDFCVSRASPKVQERPMGLDKLPKALEELRLHAANC